MSRASTMWKKNSISKSPVADMESLSPEAALAPPPPPPPPPPPDPNQPVAAQPILPYAVERFGVYQPLIGWRSQLHHERLSAAIASRVSAASRAITRVPVDKLPTSTTPVPRAVDRTGTRIGEALAAFVPTKEWPTLAAVLSERENKPFADITRSVLGDTKPSKDAMAAAPIAVDPQPPEARSPPTQRDTDRELAMAATLQQLAKQAPLALEQMFRPSFSSLNRAVAAASLFTDKHPARSSFLSPIGILHEFREFFFELGTFLGPPVGHVWISPGGTVELVEVNTRRTIVERTTEQSVETVTKTELDQTDKDELSDAVKSENSNNTKLGASATASGGVGKVFQASATASFNLDESRKQAQEQTHVKMRAQSSKLSSEVRQNFKTTFRTVNESTDTSSRRYLLQNTSQQLVSYELSRKMRKVGVQVQDLGQRLCWQLYVDNPGDPLGTGEFVHATADALDPSVRMADTKPYPPNQSVSFSSSLPFILYQGADDEAEDTYEQLNSNHDRGIFSPLVGKNDIIQFRHDIKCPPTPAGFVLSQVTALDFHGAQVKWEPNLALDALNEQFTIRLTHANFDGRKQLPFNVTLVYQPTKATKDAIDKANAASKAVYDDQVAAAKERQFYDTLRKRLKLIGSVQQRSSDDMRMEEQSVIYRAIISRLYGNVSGWSDADYHVASELVRYFFDVDAMLYFVAPDWWRPRTQELVSVNNQGELQATIIAEPALSPRIGRIGKSYHFYPGHRPYYLITEETVPAPQGASLGWLIQLDGDAHRNAFLNSPWVKAVLPIRPGRERDAMAFLQRPEVADTDGLDEPYPYNASTDPPEYKNLTIKNVLLLVADKIKLEYEASLKPVPIDPSIPNSKSALPTETVFARGFDPLEGGINFGKGAFKFFTGWTEVLPTDQVVATEYSLKGL